MGEPEPHSHIIKLLKINNLNVSEEAARQLFDYHGLLEKWNARINLTASTRWSSLEPLFGEAFWAAGFKPSPGRRLDIGSGAGFPAIPLQILKPSRSFDLVESREKRAVFLQTVVEKLGLTGVSVHTMRLRAFLDQLRDEPRWDWVSWKGIRLSQSDLSPLLRQLETGGQLWMFHGSELAVSDPARMDEVLELVRRERCPFRSSWQLSIYSPR
jgi:16S rRNA (guanine527-N7)-methyltransferase